ncbi:hypothetical protein CVT24_009428 [Panaeolus cyanescens]|uniref:ubiquitinyl hydrolase 1 n=1 Tax=Panaeolus cyanescens TaxID=181874 RepID=A0A409VCR0_9AGAR|nr:hypothetical protein CVT24_009428 [Panaeolus cyanescens]
MDDTGFFSVQVIEKALKVWGLNLIRWRSEEMRPYQDHPEYVHQRSFSLNPPCKLIQQRLQLGFILNLEQHWFTLRRFGNAEPKIEADEGNGHWFNLNSFLPAPEWVGKEYLKMVLQQSEAEGYSVFVITQADPDAPLALPRTQADVIASTMSETDSSPTSTSATRAGGLGDMADPLNVDLEDEDYELQAALQASLMATSDLPDMHIPDNSQTSLPRFPGTFRSGASSSAPQVDDPVQASMERSRLLLERMKREQEQVQRELWSEEADLSPEEAAALQDRRERRRQQEEEEERELMLAIAASERLAAEGGTPSAQVVVDPDHDDAELQAALKASLEPAHPSIRESNPVDSNSNCDYVSETGDSETHNETATDNHPGQDSSQAQVSVDEMRRKRLERFGL